MIVQYYYLPIVLIMALLLFPELYTTGLGYLVKKRSFSMQLDEDVFWSASQWPGFGCYSLVKLLQRFDHACLGGH